MRRTKSVSNQPALVRGCSNQAKDNGYRSVSKEVVTGWNNVPGDPYPIRDARRTARLKAGSTEVEHSITSTFGAEQQRYSYSRIPGSEEIQRMDLEGYEGIYSGVICGGEASR